VITGMTGHHAVCRQETKPADSTFAELLAGPLAQRGHEYAHGGEGRWNGVAILSRAGLAGREAVESARRTQADVVLLELRMRLALSPSTAKTQVNRAMVKLCRAGSRVVGDDRIPDRPG
jgi:exonuclease III